MALDAQLSSIDQGSLETLVRQALESDTVEVADWQVSPLKSGLGNPTTLGLQRLSGTGWDGGKPHNWSLVLKIAQSPANVGETNLGEGEDQRHWNYWKREMYLYQSGLLEGLPKGLAAPRCFGIEERPGDICWLWLEETKDIHAGKWTLERYALAVRHFGHFNGIYLADESLQALPWLSIGLIRQWSEGSLEWAPLFLDTGRQPGIWDHPLVRRIYPAPGDNPFLRILLERERFLDALDRLPQTLCHKDAYVTNLMARLDTTGNEETVALDWALAGMGPVGEELVQLTASAREYVKNVEPAHIDRVLFKSYLEGLGDAGWQGDIQTVRFAYVTSAVFRLGLLLLSYLNEAFQNSQKAEDQEAGSQAIEELIEAQAAYTRFVLEMAQEACHLVDEIE